MTFPGIVFADHAILLLSWRKTKTSTIQFPLSSDRNISSSNNYFYYTQVSIEIYSLFLHSVIKISWVKNIRDAIIALLVSVTRGRPWINLLRTETKFGKILDLTFQFYFSIPRDDLNRTAMIYMFSRNHAVKLKQITIHIYSGLM